MKKPIKRLSWEEAECKFLIGTFPDCDGDYQAELSPKQIKEMYLSNAIHSDEFIQILENLIELTKNQLKNVDRTESESGYLFVLGQLTALENTMRAYYNTGSTANIMNDNHIHNK